MARHKQSERTKRAASRWTARIIPAVLVGASGYCTYVLVAPLCVNYLLKKHNDKRAAVPILVMYFLSLSFMAASFMRLWYMITFCPPYLPLGPAAIQKTQRNGKGGDRVAGKEYRQIEKYHNDPDSPGLEKFYTKDVFLSEGDGRPRWCSHCANWKPDRTHHCSDVGRCVYKMDHFCPWVGGTVGENNFKFFIQFTGYTALTCLQLVVVMAIYIHKQMATENEDVSHQFIAVIALSGLFGLFTATMCMGSGRMAAINRTQIETLDAKSKIHTIALLKPPHLAHSQPMADTIPQYREITYPLPRMAGQDPVQGVNENPRLAPDQLDESRAIDETANRSTPSREGASSISSNELHSIREQSESPCDARPSRQLSARDFQAIRTFTILGTNQGDNPWDLGSYLRNWETVMGTRMIDWFLPIRRSPCCNHESQESHFQFGPVLEELKADVGFIPQAEKPAYRRRKRSSRHKGIKIKHTQNGTELKSLNGSGAESR